MKTAPLGELADLIRGVTFKPTDVNDDGIGVMRTKNVQESLELDDVMRIPASLVKRSDQYLQAGDTLISSANSWYAVGRACWVPELSEPLAIGGFVTALRPKSAGVDPRYLFRWFTSPRTQATLRSFGNKTTNISNLNLKLTAALEVPLPPLSEQRRITAILDHADALRAKRRQVLTLLDAMTQSVFTEMFSAGAFPSERAGTLMPNMRNGLSPATAGTHQAQVLTLSSVTQGPFDPSAVKAGVFAVEPPADKRITDRDFLICRGNGNKALVGVGTYSKENRPDLVFPDTVIAGTVDTALVRMPFLEAAWKRREVRAQIEAVAQTTNGTYKVNQRTLAGVLVPVPPLDLQDAFATRVARVREQERAVRRAAEADDELFASLQSRAFRGEL